MSCAPLSKLDSSIRHQKASAEYSSKRRFSLVTGMSQYNILYCMINMVKISIVYSCYRPALLVRDPRILQHILVKDFSNFTDRLTSSDKVKDPVGAGNLFCLKSTRWRKIRAKLTPTFSTSRLKIMFQRVLQSAEQTCSYIQQQEGKPINAKTLFTKSAQDSNCLTLFGNTYMYLKLLKLCL